jgi:hypothetical protein
MKRIKMVLMATAILVSVGGAFATRAHMDCRFNPQFYWNGASYIPAGTEGVDFACEGTSGVCTFIQVGNNWQACQTGIFVKIQ